MDRSEPPPLDGWTKNQLVETLADASRQIRELRAKVEEYRWVEDALKRRTQELNERIKELDLLFGIAALSRCADTPEADVLQSIVERLPSAWQYPASASARILLDGQVYKTRNYRDPSVSQTSPVYHRGKGVGVVQVCYPAILLRQGATLFLQEEQRLLDAVASWLGDMRARRAWAGGGRVEERTP